MEHRIIIQLIDTHNIDKFVRNRGMFDTYMNKR